MSQVHAFDKLLSLVACVQVPSHLSNMKFLYPNTFNFSYRTDLELKKKHLYIMSEHSLSVSDNFFHFFDDHEPTHVN